MKSSNSSSELVSTGSGIFFFKAQVYTFSFARVYPASTGGGGGGGVQVVLSPRLRCNLRFPRSCAFFSVMAILGVGHGGGSWVIMVNERAIFFLDFERDLHIVEIRSYLPGTST